MTSRRRASRASTAPFTVSVTWPQLLFLVEGDATRLPVARGAPASDEPADPVAIPIADLEALRVAWANAVGDAAIGCDRVPGHHGGIPAWTPELAELAARRRETAATLTRHALALTDYLAFGRAVVPLRQLAADLAAAADAAHGDAGGGVPAPDPEVTRLAADLQRARVAHEAAQTAYRDAVWQAVAAAASLPPPSADRPTRDGESGRDND
jgi:hypothetical protein